MIYTETVNINEKQYRRTYSDTYTICRDGAEYIEAIDPLDSGREYAETQNKLPVMNEEEWE